MTTFINNQIRIRAAAPLCGITALALLSGLAPVSRAANSSAITVKPGQSIQAAINAASAGAVITVARGTYLEQLTIVKGNVTLVGVGAVLNPPALAIHNACSGVAGPQTEAGICVVGKVRFKLYDPNDGKTPVDKIVSRISDVTIKGITVDGFSGAGIVVAAADRVRLVDNRLNGNIVYGNLVMSSPGAVVSRSSFVGPATGGIIGVCIDHSEGASVKTVDVSGYAVGICVESNNISVLASRVHGNTIGIWVDPGFKGVTVSKNTITGNTRPDPLFLGQLGLHNAGVFVDGAQGTTVEGNTITGNIATARGGGGVLVADDPNAKLTVNGTIVRNNSIHDNAATTKSDDIVLVTTGGTANTFSNNGCKVSMPAGLC